MRWSKIRIRKKNDERSAYMWNAVLCGVPFFVVPMKIVHWFHRWNELASDFIGGQCRSIHDSVIHHSAIYHRYTDGWLVIPFSRDDDGIEINLLLLYDAGLADIKPSLFRVRATSPVRNRHITVLPNNSCLRLLSFTVIHTNKSSLIITVQNERRWTRTC